MFESSLTMEEIEAAFSGVDLFTGVMEGLRDALATCHMTEREATRIGCEMGMQPKTVAD